ELSTSCRRTLVIKDASQSAGGIASFTFTLSFLPSMVGPRIPARAPATSSLTSAGSFTHWCTTGDFPSYSKTGWRYHEIRPQAEGVSGMQRPRVRRVFQCLISAGLAIVMMRMATVIRHVNHTTVALAFVLCILLLATQLGWTEALVASLAGGLAFDYYVLPPAGFMLEAPEDMVTLAAFILTAFTI